MGASVFSTRAAGKTASDAFKAAVDAAYYDYGHAGYTGSIAEKSSFTMIALPAGKELGAFVNELIDANDSRIDDKWGPAGCICLGKNPDGTSTFLFFGWASS